MNEIEGSLGFLTDEGVLYCSRECAKGRPGRDVDPDDYGSLEEAGAARAATLCPGCGIEFSVDWPERMPTEAPR